MTLRPKPHNIPVLTSYASWWASPWLIIAGTQHGQKYEALRQPIQDSFAVGQAGGAHWIVVCDGLGGASLSATGSNLVANSVNDYLGDKLASGVFPTSEIMISAARQARSVLEALALQRGVPIDAYSTTLTVAVIKNNSLTVAAIGDSSIMACMGISEGDAKIRKLIPVCSAHLSNVEKQTPSLTLSTWEHWFATTQINSPDIQAVACFTDGAEELFLTEHDPPEVDDRFIMAILNGWNNPKLGPRNIVNQLANIFSQLGQDEGSDDRTVVISMRAPDNYVPPALIPK